MPQDTPADQCEISYEHDAIRKEKKETLREIDTAGFLASRADLCGRTSAADFHENGIWEERQTDWLKLTHL